MRELKDIENSIDRETYPRNYANLRRALEAIPEGEEEKLEAEDSNAAINAASIACGLLAILNGALVGYAIFVDPTQGVDQLNIINLVFFGVCSYLIARASRVAAVMALTMYIANYFFMYVWYGRLGGLLLLIVGAVLVVGVWGTFARRKTPV